MAKYQWFFDESGVLTPCDPKVDNSTKLEFAPETDEMFYRAKLNGTLSFRFDFAHILAKGFGYTHIVVLQRYNENDGWVEVWRGRFTLTDCTINYDTKTIDVTPQTIDRYTDILNELETEYNIVKLKVATKPVTINVRPCLQIYCGGDTKLTNYVGETFWEASCESNLVDNELQNTYHFAKIGEVFAVYFEQYVPFNPPKKVIAYTNNTERDGNNQIYLTGSDGHTYICHVWQNGNERRYTVFGDDDETWLFESYYLDYQFDHIYENPLLTVPPNALTQWSAVYSRVLLQTELAQITLVDTVCTTYDIPTNDIAGAVNMNYNKVAPIPTACVHFLSSTTVSDDPTEWGQSYTDQYFVRPTVTGYHLMPVAPAQWKYASLWYYPYYRYSAYIDNYSAQRTIRDGYDLRQTILRLCQKAGLNPPYIISGCLGGSQTYVGANLLPIITPKSNVISSYYDTPAQNAPISLAKIFRMLKQAYKVYWYIDENDNIHIEHISYFMNGNWYEPQPQQLVDLENTIHTRTKHSKAYGQNVVKFDKSNMAAIFTFGWMDTQTKPFDGYDIKCLDPYVAGGTSTDNRNGDFDTDVDYVLSSPNDVSKDGFFLFALPYIGGSYSNALIIERMQITDEIGDTYEIKIQNADGAFCKIQQTWWRYDMPCENLQINNQADTAITTGRFKQQTVEYADLTMADIIENVDNCVKLIRTQQGDGGISKLSVNLNSLASSADLVFTLFGRKYYLKGAALAGSFTITLNGEQITINVENNRFVYGYTEPINELSFKNTNVVSVDFADTDKLDDLTSADEMFKNCVELVAVDFSNKTFGAVTSATDMFAGCVQLSQLIVPTTETWKPDIDFTDCPALTLESFNDFITKYLYVYESGVHTITPNTTFWNGLAPETQTDLMNKATAKGWQIGIPAQYSLTGTSTGSTVYVTINGSPVEISVSGGVWQYDYNTPITSISFLNDTNVTTIDFTNSDLLDGVTSLNDAFKGCSGLVSVDFTGCDLSNVATAADAFAGCSSLTTITADSGVWMPDIDLSDSAMVYADMLSTIGILYTYATGTHTITFNQTTWDSLSVAQQQTIFDAAQLKYWATNAVAVVYTISGKSTAASETFDITFIQDGSLIPDAAETITVIVDGNGDWSFSYMNKKVYSLYKFAINNSTITSFDFSAADDFSALTNMYQAFYSMSAITAFDFSGKLLQNVTDAEQAFNVINACTTIDLGDATFASLTNAKSMFSQTASSAAKAIDLRSATFNSLQNAYFMFNGIKLTALDLSVATFENVTNAQGMFGNISSTIGISMPIATFESATITQQMFGASSGITSISIPNATFENVVTATQMIYNCPNLTSLNLDKATFNSVTSANYMFNVLTKLQAVSLPLATFKNVTTAIGIFSQYNNAQMTTIYIPNATFESITVTSYANFFNGNFGNSIVNWTSKAVGVDNKSIGVSFAFYAPRLNYASYLNVANWLKDLSGMTTQTITISSVAWNALSSAEQTTIQGILSGKNWNLATA